MRVQIGFTSSTKNEEMKGLHKSKAIFCTDEDSPRTYGRAKVLTLRKDPAVWRYGGVAVVYGKSSPSIFNLLRKQAPPVLVAVIDGPIVGSKSAQILERLEASGHTVITIQIQDGDVGKVIAYHGIAEVLTLTSEGSPE